MKMFLLLVVLAYSIMIFIINFWPLYLWIRYRSNPFVYNLDKVIGINILNRLRRKKLLPVNAFYSSMFIFPLMYLCLTIPLLTGFINHPEKNFINYVFDSLRNDILYACALGLGVIALISIYFIWYRVCFILRTNYIELDKRNSNWITGSKL